MKPKTVLHKKVVALSGQLPSITAANTLWAQGKCTAKYVVRSIKSLYCLECGHKWTEPCALGTILLGETCPSCNQKLTLYREYKPYMKKYHYFSAVTTIKDMQVVRMYFLTKTFHKNKPADYFIQEVMQHWITETGKVTTMARKSLGLTSFFDQWNTGSTLEVRGYMSNQNAKFNLCPEEITPGRKILPVFKRNGYQKNFYGYAPHHFFILILTNPLAETLLKTKQVSLFRFANTHPQAIKKYWPSIRICIRNKYLVTDASIWIDYLNILNDFGKDLLSPKYACPANLHHEHNKLLAKKKKVAAKRKLIEMLAILENDQKVYIKEKRKFLQLVFIKGNMTVKPLQTVKDFYQEGELLEHCVYHSAYHKKKNSLVLSATIDNVPTETIEVSLKPLKIVQSRGLFNKPTPYHENIVKLVESNLNAISKCI